MKSKRRKKRADDGGATPINLTTFVAVADPWVRKYTDIPFDPRERARVMRKYNSPEFQALIQRIT